VKQSANNILQKIELTTCTVNLLYNILSSFVISKPILKMMLIGYRMLFGEMCTLLNVYVDPDADYVEDDLAREALVSNILQSIKGTNLSVLVLSDDVYYLGLSVEICCRALPPIIPAKQMSEQIAKCSIHFQRELKKVGLFKYLEGKAKRVSEPMVVQCERIHPITA
jgi:hypothetical protein